MTKKRDEGGKKKRAGEEKRERQKCSLKAAKRDRKIKMLQESRQRNFISPALHVWTIGE